jgi:hypothetical protein
MTFHPLLDPSAMLGFLSCDITTDGWASLGNEHVTEAQTAFEPVGGDRHTNA